LAIAAEFFGGLGLFLGLLTRIAAFGIGINMIVAILTVHGAFGFFMNRIGAQKGEGIEYHLLVLAMAVFPMIRGAGALSVDRALTVAATCVAKMGTGNVMVSQCANPNCRRELHYLRDGKIYQ
jgi:uncharacterized membrane protein YphA (DoxX/SURF4 family)